MFCYTQALKQQRNIASINLIFKSEELLFSKGEGTVMSVRPLSGFKNGIEQLLFSGRQEWAVKYKGQRKVKLI